MHLKLKLFLLFTCARLQVPARSEEQSVMSGCVVTDFNKWVGNSFEPTASVLCDGGYKTFFQSLNAANQEITITLTTPATIVSVFVSTEAAFDQAKPRFGTERIWVGSNNTTPFTTEPAMTRSSEPFYDTGFYKLTPTTGPVIVLRREGALDGSLAYNNILVNEVRAYQTPNILLELEGSTKIITAPDPISPLWSAQNLITNLSRRTSGNSLYPTIDGAGKKATFQSCFRTDSTKLSAFGNKMVLTIDLTMSFFQHAILFVADLGDGYYPQTGFQYLENVRVYVGDSPDYLLNAECAGGPFLVKGNLTSSYVKGAQDSTSSPTDLWKFGEEVWCNKPGRYTTLVSDMTQMADIDYKISLCQLGVMATIYERSTPAPTALTIIAGKVTILTIEKIKTHHSYPIGNTLNIKMRSNPPQAKVTFIEQPDASIVTLNPTATDIGTFKLVLESFDDAGALKSTLKSDEVLLTILPPECGQALTQSVAFETIQPIVLIQEYQPTVYFPKMLFTGPHTFSGYACGGTYTQRITIDPPVTGVVITDHPTGTDQRPSLAIDATAPASTTFTLNFVGHYLHAPSSTDIRASFSQTYVLKSVLSTAYLNQPTITHSLTAAQLTFTVPPAAPGVVPPTQTLASSQFTVAYPIKAGTSDSLGNTPPTIVPVPYAGFTSAAIVKGQSSLGTTTLASPRGSLIAVGFSGDLNSGSTLSFQCNPWSVSIQGTSVPKTLIFANSDVLDFQTSLSVTCAYEQSTLPVFASALANESITSGVAKTWTLPLVTDGSLDPTKFRLETATEVAGFMLLNAITKTVSYNGNQFGTSFSTSTVTLVLIDSAAQENSFTQTLTILPPECGQALTQSVAFETTQPIVLIQEYQPTVYFPQMLFTGPHTFSGYACGGTYTQSITIDPPVTGVVITDHPTGTDQRPSLAIDATAPASTTFTLNFVGRYQHAPTSTDIRASFSQTYVLKSVLSTAYLNQPTITHSLTAAQLTFTVPPAAPGVVPPTQTLASSQFTVAYPIKTGTSDSLGNTPPTIVPVPYAGFTSAAIVKGQSSLGTTTLASPRGSLIAVGFSGDLNSGSTLSFQCSPWTPELSNTHQQLSLLFRNSVAPNLMSSFAVDCQYGAGSPLKFKSELETVVLQAGTQKKWVLPSIDVGTAGLRDFKFEPDVVISAFLTFDPDLRTVSYNGNTSISQLKNQALKIDFTLINSSGLKSTFSQFVSISDCPITDEQVDALSISLAGRSLALSLEAGKVGFVTTSYNRLLADMVESLGYDQRMQQQCGPIKALLVSSKPFLYEEPSAQLLILLADEHTVQGSYEDAYFSVTLNAFSWRVPVRVEFTDCILTSLSFESRFVAVTYLVGSGIHKAELPMIVQKPDCGLGYQAVKIKNIEAAQPEGVLKAVKLDNAAAALMIETSDASLTNSQASLTLSIDSQDGKRVENLIVEITFKRNSTHSAPASVDLKKSTEPGQISLDVNSKKLGIELGIPAFEVPPLSLAQASLLEMPVAQIPQEKLFVSVPLAARLSKGVDYLKQFVLEQRKYFAWQKDLPKESQPLDALFVELSNAGVLDMRFSSQMQFPNDTIKTIQTNGKPALRRLEANQTAVPRIELYAVRSQDPNEFVDLGPLLQNWDLEQVGETGLSISLNFAAPLHVSTMDYQPDVLFIQLELSQFFDNRGKSLPESLVKQIAIPRQIATKAEAEMIDSAGSAAIAAAAGVISGSVLINILLAGSLYKVWSLINSLQVVQMIRMFNVKSPGNVNAFTDFFNDITSMAFLNYEVQKTTEKIIDLPEKEAVSINFQNAGFDTSYFVPNVQVLVCFILGHLGQVVPYLLLRLFERCCSCAGNLRRKLGVYLFWNGSIRLILETYFDIMLFLMVNFYELDGGDQQRSVQINNWFAGLLGAVYLLGSAILLCYFCINVRRHENRDPDFDARYGAFFEGARRKREYRCAVLLLPTSFLLKRLLLCVSLVFMQDFFWGQVASQLFFTTYMIILHQGGRPIADTIERNLETFNEVATFFVLYLLMYFSDFNHDDELRNNLGYVYIIVVSLFAVVHLLFMLTDICRKVSLTCKRYYNRCCRKRPPIVRKIQKETPEDAGEISQVDGVNQPAADPSQSYYSSSYDSSSVSQRSVAAAPLSSVESLPRNRQRYVQEEEEEKEEQKWVNIPIKVSNSHLHPPQKLILPVNGNACPNLSDISDVEDAPVPAIIAATDPKIPRHGVNPTVTLKMNPYANLSQMDPLANTRKVNPFANVTQLDSQSNVKPIRSSLEKLTEQQQNKQAEYLKFLEMQWRDL